MPIQKTSSGGYRWGGHGKTYTGKSAHAKAVKQMQAAYAHGYRGAGKKRGK